MKAILLIIISILSLPICGQNHIEAKINNLLATGDFIKLAQCYNSLKDSLPPLLSATVESYLDCAFNRPQQSVEKMRLLIGNYQHEFGAALLPLIHLWAYQLYDIGKYDEAADILYSLRSQLQTQHASSEMIQKYYSLYKMCDGLRNTSPRRVKRLQDGDDEVKLTIDVPLAKIGWVVPVNMGHANVNAFLDTGAGITFMTTEVARKNKIRVVADSIPFGGIGGSGIRLGKLGIIDSLRIGNVCCYNLPVCIAGEEGVLPKAAQDSLGSDLDLVIGVDIMQSIGEMEICPPKNTVRFPEEREEKRISSNPNLMIVNRLLFTEAYYKGLRLLLGLDSGMSTEGYIEQKFVEKHADIIKKADLLEARRYAGFAGVVHHNAYGLQNFYIQIGDKKTNLRGMVVELGTLPYDGFLGISYFKQLREISFDFNRMILTVR
ncbi:MAG: retropepsin-like domain-containing protein [Mediterranea sp.]|jgi:predicted aspartyl protease|nr:retropepsin-like domain-containing protein [Mediterranea sp.]